MALKYSETPLTLRRLASTELDEAATVVTESGLGTPVEELRLRAAWPASELVGAWRDGRLVGVAGAFSYDAFGVIGPMSVLPAAQGRGIGTALLRHVVAWLQRRGTEVITLDATQAGAPLYRRHGFVTDYWTLHLGRDAQGGIADSSADSTVQAAMPEDADAIGRFDAPLFGARRDDVLAAYLAAQRGRAVLLRRNESIRGYALAQQRRIGPVVAADPADAEYLFDAMLALPYEDAPIVSLAETNAAGCALLARRGFTELRRLERMRLGGHVHPGEPDRLYGVLSYALG